MKGYDIVRLPEVRNKMLKNVPGKKGLKKLATLLERRSKELFIYELFNAHDRVAIDLYPKGKYNNESFD